MPEEVNNQAVEASKPEKIGCGAWLGMFLLLVIVLTVAFFLLIKPRLEAQGVDVDSRLEDAKTTLRELGGRSTELVGEAVDKAKDLKDTVSETSEKVEDLKDEAAEKAEQAKEATKAAAGKVKEGAEAVESWY